MWRSIFIILFFGLTLLPGLQMGDRYYSGRYCRREPFAGAPSHARYATRTSSAGCRSVVCRSFWPALVFDTDKDADRLLRVWGVGPRTRRKRRATVLSIRRQRRGACYGAVLATQEAPALQGIDSLSKSLAQVGIHVVFIVNMMSDRFYPELLPSSVIPRPSYGRIDDFVDKLRAIPNVIFIDSTAVLRETMQSRRIFHRTDFHWNDPAAFVSRRRSWIGSARKKVVRHRYGLTLLSSRLSTQVAASLRSCRYSCPHPRIRSWWSTLGLGQRVSTKP